MAIPRFSRLPRHVAVIPDGNRRWAQERGLGKEAGYAFGLQPGLALCDLCLALGIEEITAYGYTQDNTKRPAEQREAFQRACVEIVDALRERDVAFLAVGNTDSTVFPPELLPFTRRQIFGRGTLRANLLVNYDWQWDLRQASLAPSGRSRSAFMESLGSADVSRIDLIIRWGGRRRLSGLLPVQSVYADFYVLDEYWPDFHPDQFYAALRWYEQQDVTLGG
ncbi:MAG: undecaprenyl diphosphate synthase family protein [Armatimonadota bacterium]